MFLLPVLCCKTPKYLSSPLIFLEQFSQSYLRCCPSSLEVLSISVKKVKLSLLTDDMILYISSVQFSCSVVSDSWWPQITAHQASLSITNSQSLPKFMSIELMMPSSHLVLCCPLFLLPPIFPSIRVFFSGSNLHMRWPKYWSFSFNISPSNEYPGLISFRMDWLDLLLLLFWNKQLWGIQQVMYLCSNFTLLLWICVITYLEHFW